MERPVFQEKDDGWWWVICMGQYFKTMGTPEEEKLTEALKAMRGLGRTWYLWWIPRHPKVDWDAFTGAFLWYFKPEFRDMLPYDKDGQSREELEEDNEVLDDRTETETTKSPLVTIVEPSRVKSQEKVCAAQILDARETDKKEFFSKTVSTVPRKADQEGIFEPQPPPKPPDLGDSWGRKDGARTGSEKEEGTFGNESPWELPPKPPDYTIQGLNFLSPINAQHLCISVWDGNASLAMSFYSSYLIIPWDPGKPTTVMSEIACEYCWGNFSSTYGLLHFVYDRGKIWEAQIDVRNHKVEAILIPINPSPTTRNYKPYRSRTTPNASRTRPSIEQHLTLRLEDKSVFRGGSIDRPFGM